MRGGGQFEPAADNCAMQHRDDRQRTELDRLEGFVPRARMQHAFCDAALLQFREIEACAEMVPSPTSTTALTCSGGRLNQCSSEKTISSFSALRLAGRA